MTFTAAFNFPLLVGGDYETGYALSAIAYPTREQAALELSAFVGREIDPGALEADRARWQFAPEGIEPSPGWWLGASGKGSRPVWVWWTP